MRKKKQITLRIEWIETIATLISSLQLDVMNAVIAYLTDGTVTKIDNIDAAEMFMDIKKDIDARAEERRRKAAERRAKKAPVPGYLPEKAPENLEELVQANEVVATVVNNSSVKNLRMYHKPLLMELALQVVAWWREHPSEELPTPARLQAEIYRRFSAVARELATGTVVTREKWVAYLAPFAAQKRSARFSAKKAS